MSTDVNRRSARSTEDNNRRNDDADTIHRVENVLRDLADAYYEGCKQYEIAPKPDSSQRVFWRIRLAAIADIGDQLADALHIASPDWETFRDLTRTHSPTVQKGR